MTVFENMPPSAQLVPMGSTLSHAPVLTVPASDVPQQIYTSGFGAPAVDTTWPLRVACELLMSVTGRLTTSSAASAIVPVAELGDPIL